jgi:hypothetical protein
MGVQSHFLVPPHRRVHPLNFGKIFDFGPLAKEKSGKTVFPLFSLANGPY